MPRGEISKIDRRALTIPVDLASEDETTAGAVGRTVEALGRVDVLVNAAARMRPVRWRRSTSRGGTARWP